MARGDVDARTYEERATDGLGAEIRRFALGSPAENAVTHTHLAATLAALPEASCVLASSTILPLVGPAFRAQSRRLRIVVLAHRPSHRDPRFVGMDERELANVDAGTLPYARRVVAPSLHTAMSLGAIGVLPDQLAVIMPAADRAPLAEGSRTRGEGLSLVCAAPLTIAAGHDVLIDALGPLAGRGWRLTCVAPEADPEWLAQMQAKADRFGLARQVHWKVGASASDVKSAYHAADLVVLPARYDPHGTGVLEALARGVPVLATSAGAAGRLLPEGAGVLVRAGESSEMTRALAVVCDNDEVLARLTQGAERARAEVRVWSRVAAELKREVDVACR